jgi:hypothetical protein
LVNRAKFDTLRLIDRLAFKHMAGKIFLSYRRKDEQGYALALFTRLEQSFSPERLFLDVEGGIAPGQDFVQVIEDKVNACDVMLVLIGPKWLPVTDEMGRRRLDNPQDFVRIEIESALRLGKTVIPVLVGNTEMPRADALPETLKSLTRLQAVVLAERRFGADAQGLIKQLENTLKEETPIRRRLLQLGAPICLVAIAGASWLFLFLYDESIRTFSGHDDFVRSVAFAPDGVTALSGSSSDSTVRLWEIASGKEIHRLSGHTGSVFSVSFAPDGRTALSGGPDGTVRLWDIATLKEIRSFKGDSITSVAFAPNGRSALSGDWDTTLKLWDIETGEELRRFTGHTRSVTSVAFAPDGVTALSGSSDKTVRLWDVASGKEIRRFPWHTDEVTSVAFAPDGRTALSGSKDGTLKLLNVENGEELRRFTGHSVWWSVAFAPDGRTALSGGHPTSLWIPFLTRIWSNTLKLWDIESGKEIRNLTGHHGSVYAVAFAPDGRTALSGSSDGTLKLWDLGVPR